MQWLRQCKLTVQIDSGQPEALDLSDFHIHFRINQATVSTPKATEIYIYNISSNTMNRLCGQDTDKVNGQVLLEVGYKGGPLETIFKGRVFQYRRGRDNPTDTWLCILAQSGDVFKNYALINQCVPAGTTINKTGQVLVQEASKTGLDIGKIPELSDQAYPRGRVFFGSLDDHIQQFCKDNNLDFDVSDDYLTVIPYGGYHNEDVQVITADTGMIGMPQLTTEGLKVTTLINPKYRFGGRVQVDLSNLQVDSYDIDYASQGLDQPYKTAKLATNAQGLFIIKSIEMVGDTRGDEWYSNLVCVAPDAVQPMSGITITAVDQ